MQHNVVLIPGDGIGPEVCNAVKRVLEAAGADIKWIERHAGLGAVDRGSDTVLPLETIEAIKAARRGELMTVGTVDDLLTDLHADD